MSVAMQSVRVGDRVMVYTSNFMMASDVTQWARVIAVRRSAYMDCCGVPKDLFLIEFERKKFFIFRVRQWVDYISAREYRQGDEQYEIATLEAMMHGRESKSGESR